MRIVAFMNQKGGVGKTTTAVSIGALLAAEYGKRVLLIDLDPQGNLSDHLGLDPAETTDTVYNVIIDGLPARQAVRSVHGVDVLPANIDLSGAEIELAGMMMRELRLKNAVAELCREYDYVLLDCPPSLGLLTISGLVLADEVIVPMQAEYLALRGLTQLLNTVKLVREHLNPRLAVAGVIFCMYDGRTNLARTVRDEVEKFFPGKVYATAVRKNVRLAEAPSFGQPVNRYDSACAGTSDYRALAEEFLTRCGDGAVEPSRRQPVWKGDEEAAAQSAAPGGNEKPTTA